MLPIVPRREIGVLPVESDLETAPVLWRTGVLVPAGGVVLGVLSRASLCVLVTEGTADLLVVGVLGVGVLGDMLAEL